MTGLISQFHSRWSRWAANTRAEARTATPTSGRWAAPLGSGPRPTPMFRPGPADSQRRLSLLLSLGLGLLALPAIDAGRARAAAPLGSGSREGHNGEGLSEPQRPSTPAQKALSEHLRRRGAVFYGAWWCPACAQQKELFGKEGSQRLPYLECARDTAGRQRCEAAEIRAYPTWDLPGKPRLEGVQSLEELQIWSDFQPAGRRSAPASQPSR